MKEENNKEPTIIGSSVINHNARVKLGLSVSEYVMLQFLQGLQEDGFPPEEYVCWAQLGVSLETMEKGIAHLQSKNLLIAGTDSLLRPIDLWYKIHKEKGFEFGLFWQPVTIGTETVEWRNSSKTATKKLMTNRLKEVPIEQLIYSKLRYFISKWESKSFDYVMGAPVFLGPDKHYEIRYALKPDSEQELGRYIRKFYGPEGTINLLAFLTKQQQETAAVIPVLTDDYFND